MRTLRDSLVEVTVGVLGCDRSQITDAANFSDLGADSLDMVELVMAIEDRFAVSIDDDELERISTFGHALALVVVKVPAA